MEGDWYELPDLEIRQLVGGLTIGRGRDERVRPLRPSSWLCGTISKVDMLDGTLFELTMTIRRTSDGRVHRICSRALSRGSLEECWLREDALDRWVRPAAPKRGITLTPVLRAGK